MRGFEFEEWQPDRFELPMRLGGAYQRLSAAFTDYRKRTEDALRERFGHKFNKEAYLRFVSDRRSVSLQCLAANAVALYAMHEEVLPAHDGLRKTVFVTLQLFCDDKPFVHPTDHEIADKDLPNLYTLPLAAELPPCLVAADRLRSYVSPEEWVNMPKHTLSEPDCRQLVDVSTGWTPEVTLRDPGLDGLEIALR